MPIITQLEKQDFEKILNRYDIGRYKSHKHINWALQNTVYIFSTSKGDYVLKIFETASERAVNQQIKIINYLTSKNIPVATILKAKNKKEVAFYKDKPFIIQIFLE